LPRDGYTTMLTDMIAHEKIQCRFCFSVNTYLNVAEIFHERCPVVYTGALDTFAASYDYLSYRKIDFTHVNIPARDFHLPAASINECDCDRLTEHTRVTDNGIFSAYQRGERSRFTTLTYEQPVGAGVSCYPIPWDQASRDLHVRLLGQFKIYPLVYFAGRLADYKYYNMDQAILRGMEVAKLILAGQPQER